MSLKDAPVHVQLAVDLIQILEENRIDPDTALAALAIVTQDYQNKKLNEAEPDDADKA